MLETLSAFLADGVRDGLVAESLEVMGWERIPDDPAFLLFVRGPLRDGLERRMGGDTADAVVEELLRVVGPVVARQSGIVRRRARVSTEDGGSAEPSADRARLVCLGDDGQAAERMRACLAERADVVLAAHVPDLLGALSAHVGPVAIVLDCRRASIDPAVLSLLDHVLPAGSTVVVWAAGPELLRPLQRLAGRRVAPAAVRWTDLPAKAEPERVAEAGLRLHR